MDFNPATTRDADGDVYIYPSIYKTNIPSPGIYRVCWFKITSHMLCDYSMQQAETPWQDRAIVRG
jgi:hypothetical protein